MMAELALASASATEMTEKLEQEKEAVENTSDGYAEAQNAFEPVFRGITIPLRRI